jgi:uncharacterized protein YoaH (UPF0181 family)
MWRVDVESEDNHNLKPYEQVDNILESQVAPVEKMRQLMAIGYGEEEAALLVEQHEAGTRQPVYYEQLPEAAYEPDDLYWD